MTQEEKELLLKDLCARMPYGVKLWAKAQELAVELARIDIQKSEVTFYTCKLPAFTILDASKIERFDQQVIKPYLRPMDSMTEEEVKELSILYGLKDILSTKITDEYIEVVVDDGFCSTETRTIWYNEIISSIEIFDWLNKHHFDYRGLIEKGFALPAPKDMYDFKSN